MQKTTIGIIGTGRFATILKSLLERSADVSVIQSSTTKQIDRITIFELEEVLNADVVIFAIPISSLEQFLVQHAHLIHSTPLCVDVCSVKVLPARWMMHQLPQNVDILATHPLFGPTSTKQGTSFDDLKCVFAPIRITDQCRLRFFTSLFKSQGITTHIQTAEEHDRLMARTQAMAFVFGHLGRELNLHTSDFDTAGFRALLLNQSIVASDSHKLLIDIFRFNPFAAQMLTQMRDSIIHFEREINASLYFYDDQGKG